MATLSQYFTQLRTKQDALSKRIGSWLPGMAVEPRVVLACSDATFAVLMKLLVDKGLITDAELQAAFNAATVADFTTESAIQPNALNDPA